MQSRSVTVVHRLAQGARLGALGALVLPVALIAAFLLAFTGSAQAQTTGSTINVFCLDFGKTFPEGQTIKAQGLANDKVRAGLAYAQSKGYVTSNPYQVQLAVWNLQDNQPFHDQQNQGTTIAQEIVNNANGAPPSGDASAVANLTLTNIHQTSPTAAYGTATVQGGANTGGLPVGFLLPATSGNFQNLVAVVSSGTAQQAAATTTSSTTSSSAGSASTSATTSQATTTTSSSTSSSTTTSSTTTATMASALPSTGAGGTSDGVGAIALFALIGLAGAALLLGSRGTRAHSRG